MPITKYYIPTISEFHAGFEFEMNECDGLGNFDWNENIFCQTIQPNEISYIKKSILWDFMELNDAIKNENVRVKYIDKEDCLSLGLELKVWDGGSGYFKIGAYTIGIYGADLFCTVSQIDYGNQIIRFSGDLKNKSELQRVLKQVGCIK